MQKSGEKEKKYLIISQSKVVLAEHQGVEVVRHVKGLDHRDIYSGSGKYNFPFLLNIIKITQKHIQTVESYVLLKPWGGGAKHLSLKREKKFIFKYFIDILNNILKNSIYPFYPLNRYMFFNYPFHNTGQYISIPCVSPFSRLRCGFRYQANLNPFFNLYFTVKSYYK